MSLLSIRSVSQIRQDLLENTSEDRRDYLELLFDWLQARERHLSGKGFLALSAFEQKMGGEKSPALRAATLIAEMEGAGTVYRTTSQQTSEQELDLIIVDIERLENIQRYPIVKNIPRTPNPIIFNGGEALSDCFMRAEVQKHQDAAAEFLEDNFISLLPKLQHRMQ